MGGVESPAGRAYAGHPQWPRRSPDGELMTGHDDDQGVVNLVMLLKHECKVVCP